MSCDQLHHWSLVTMKRTRSSQLETLCIVSGCICNTGQGYSPCICPRSLEVTKEEAMNRSKWNYRDVLRLEEASEQRIDGKVVKWHHNTLEMPCTKQSKCYELLIKGDEFRAALLPYEQPRYHIAFFMNGTFRYWPVTTVQTAIKKMDEWEATINAAVVTDRLKRQVWCFEGPIDPTVFV